LIEALAKAENLASKKAGEVVNTVFGDMEKALIQGNESRSEALVVSRSRTYEGTGEDPNRGNHQCLLQETPVLKVGKSSRTESIFNHRPNVLGRARWGASGAL